MKATVDLPDMNMTHAFIYQGLVDMKSLCL